MEAKTSIKAKPSRKGRPNKRNSGPVTSSPDVQPAEPDYTEQWSNYLSHGAWHYSRELFTPDTAFIASPNGSKISVIGDEGKSPILSYDVQNEYVLIDLRFLRRHSPMGFTYSSLSCPACETPYTVSFKDCLPNDILSVNRAVIYMDRNSSFFDCACGVSFFFDDKYQHVHLPFTLEELAPLYQLGMPLNTDLLLRYVLSSNNLSLVEEVGVIPKNINEESSLTDNPLRRFYWTIPPFFSSEGNGRYEGVRNIRIWRKRAYSLGSDSFEEEVYHPYQSGWEKVIRNIRYIPDYFFNKKLLESLVAASKSQLKMRATHRGRNPESGKLDNMNIEDLIDIYAYLWAKHQQIGVIAPTQYDLAAYLGVDRTTVWRRIKTDLNWQELKSQGKERAQTLPLNKLEKEISQLLARPLKRIGES